MFATRETKYESDFDKEFGNNVNIQILKTKQVYHNPEYKQTTIYKSPSRK